MTPCRGGRGVSFAEIFAEAEAAMAAAKGQRDEGDDDADLLLTDVCFPRGGGGGGGFMRDRASPTFDEVEW